MPGDARAVRTVTAGTCRDAGRKVPAAIELLAARGKVLALGRFGLQLLRPIVGREVAHVLVREVGDNSGHQRIVAIRLLAGGRLEVLELLAQILRKLAGNFRVRCSRAVPVGGMTRHADLGGNLLSLCGVGLCCRLRASKARQQDCARYERQCALHFLYSPGVPIEARNSIRIFRRTAVFAAASFAHRNRPPNAIRA